MKKLVIKTAVITLAVIIALVGLLFGAFCLFSPVTLAKFFDGAGNYSLSVTFYEKQYKKTQDLSDLYVLSVKLDQGKDAQKTERYLSVFLTTDGVNDYCKKYDDTNSAVTTYEYLNGKYVCALYSVKGIDQALDYLEESVCDEYNDYNGYSILLGEYSSNLSNEELNKILQSLNGLTVQSRFKDRDIKIVTDLLT